MAERTSPRSAFAADLWTIVAGAGGTDPAADRAVLSEAERARADAFAAPADGWRFARFRSAVRRILARYVGMDPKRLAFVEGPFGKPRLEAVDAPEFSLSHCGDLAALAVARGASVGLDIETLRQFPRADRIASRIFCAQEWADYAALDPADRPQAFFRAWTRKEAYLKAIGDGFATAPETVNVTLAPDDPPRLRGVCGRPDEPARWTLCDVTPAPGVVGALAVSASDIRLRWIRDEEDAP